VHLLQSLSGLEQHIRLSSPRIRLPVCPASFWLQRQLRLSCDRWLGRLLLVQFAFYFELFLLLQLPSLFLTDLVQLTVAPWLVCRNHRRVASSLVQSVVACPASSI